MTPQQQSRLFTNIAFWVLVVLLTVIFGMFWQSFKRGAAVVHTPTPTATISPDAHPAAVSAGKAPTMPLSLPAGFVVHVFADHLAGARDLAFSPGGTLLVSSPDAGTVTAFPDANHDGVADSTKTVISGFKFAHGLAFHGDQLFVAGYTALNRYNWDETTQTATFDKTLFSIPANDDHNRRTLSITGTGQLYLTVGSSCNVCNDD